MRRVALLLSLLAAGAFAAPAAAVQPAKTTFDVTGIPATLSGVCSFDVAVSTRASGTEIDYVDASGALTRIYVHQVEQDTFSANGKSITGLPYTFAAEILFDAAGNVTHVYASGVVERLVLPSGTLFLSAGRLDFVLHPGVTFLLSPDVGQSGDIAAFCAALS